MEYKLLFSPIVINKLQLENRIMMAPTHDNLATMDGFVTPVMIDSYLKRAKGGLSIIVLGGVFVNPRRLALVPRLSDDQYIPGMKEITDRIHSETGVKICAQLTDSLKIARGGWKQNFNDLTIEDIHKIIGYFKLAAIRTREAGIDAIELHGAHGYTLCSSLSLRNKREDDYGGTIDGRMRMLIETYQTVRDTLGPDYPIGVRLNGDEFIIEGNSLQQSRVIARKCAEMGINYISISAGGKYEDSQGLIPKYELPANYPPFGGYSGFRAMPPAWMPEAVNVYLAEDIRRTVRQAGYSTPVITAGRIPYPKLAEEILLGERADLIALSRPLLRDPDWPKKAKEGREKEINRCTYCNYCLERENYDEPGFCKYLNE
ncbi:hypothetical protein ACFLXL_01120 [Chloroflexota bacterium]